MVLAGDFNILVSFFTCSDNTPPDQVLYRAEIQGGNCTRLVRGLESVIKSSSAPSLVVRGNVLEIRQDCNVEAAVIDADLVCPRTDPTSSPTITNSPSQLGVIVGGVVAGVAVIVLLVIILLVLVVSCRRRHMMKTM